MTTDAQALAIALRALPLESRAALHLALSVSRFESHWGDGWSVPPKPGTLLADQTAALGLTGTEGAGSNNWGAVHTASEPSFPHLDHHADGSPYEAKFTVNPTPEAGFKQVAFEVLKPNVRAAADAGNGTEAVFAMHSNGYFEASPELYASNVARNYENFLKATGEPRLLTFPASSGQPAGPSSPGSSGGTDLFEVALGLGLALGTAWVLDWLPKPKAPPPKGGQP